MARRNAFVTLLADDTYAVGVVVWAAALKHHRTAHDVGCLVTDKVSEHAMRAVEKAVDFVERVPAFNSNDAANLARLGRPDLGVSFSKISAWRLTGYSRACFMDADTIVLRNVDELLDENGPYEPFAAAPDIGWPDMFNSGVFVFRPSEEDFGGLRTMAAEKGSFDGGDQGLLNQYFNQWSRSTPSHRLPFIYNVTPSATYSYAPAYRAFRESVAIFHFIGLKKPWHWLRLSNGDVVDAGNLYQTEAIKAWWDIYDWYMQPGLPQQILGLHGIPGAHCAFGGMPPPPAIIEPSDFETYHVDWNADDVNIVPKSTAGGAQASLSRVPVRLNVDDPDDEEVNRMQIRAGCGKVGRPSPSGQAGGSCK